MTSTVCGLELRLRETEHVTGLCFFFSCGVTHLLFLRHVLRDRFHPGVQSECESGGPDELWERREHAEVLHHLRPAGGIRAVRRQHEPRRHHVAQQEASPVHPCTAGL